MSFHIKILLLSFFTSIVIAFVVIPILRKLKAGQSEREDGPQSFRKIRNTNNGWNYNDNFNIDIKCILVF